jgi:Protein of unknown function (DUF3631)
VTNAALDQQILDQEARQGERALNEVYDFLGRFVSHTLWCAHAHLMNHWESTPRLALLSAEPASGKTRALEVTLLLVPNPVLVANMSATYLFPKVGENAGAVTILVDEIDTIFGPKTKDQHEDIRGLLNAGHRKGAVTGRCVVRGKSVETEDIPAYAPVAVAGLDWLPDTLMTRSIVIRMRRRHPDEVVEPYRPRLHDRQGHGIGHRLESWAATLEHIDLDAVKLPPGIQDRDADCWEPLLAVADAAGGPWPERARAAAVSLVSAGRDREPSLGIKLLTDIKTVFAATTAMPTKVLLQRLTELQESPWGDIRGKPLDERGLAQRLRQYGIKSRQIRVGDTTLKGYRREDFADAWKRYVLVPVIRSETGETYETSQQNQMLNVSDAPKLGETRETFDSGGADNVSDVSDGVSDVQLESRNKFNDVSDVSHVSQNRGLDPDDYVFNLDDYPDLPPALDRRP